MAWCSFILLMAVSIQYTTLVPTPVDDLTINVNLNDSPEGENSYVGDTNMKGTIFDKEFRMDTYNQFEEDTNPTCKTKKKKLHENRKRILGGATVTTSGRDPTNLASEPDWKNWMASIRIKVRENPNSYKICGGVLISNQHILTSLSCITPSNSPVPFPYPNVEIFFDPLNEHVEKFAGTKFEPIDYFYVNKAQRKVEYLDGTKIVKDDIVVIKLSEPIKASHSLRPIPITDIAETPDMMDCYWIAGWGIIGFTPKGEAILPRDLHFTNKIPRMECPQSTSIQQPGNFCLKNTNKDALCPGDTGSPGVTNLQALQWRPTCSITGRKFYIGLLNKMNG